MENQLLKIYYDRVYDSEDVELTTSNCNQYGFSWTTIKDVVYGTNKEVIVFYPTNGSSDNYLQYEQKDENTFVTYHTNEFKRRYEHISPPCSSFAISFADVDKEGSGRNPATGLMERERIGYYRSIDVTYDLIPSSKEYNNWYKILTHLPPDFYIQVLTPNGNIEEIRCYRADVSTELYLFAQNYQIWRGLKTSFIQFDVTPYNESEEPNLD